MTGRCLVSLVQQDRHDDIASGACLVCLVRLPDCQYGIFHVMSARDCHQCLVRLVLETPYIRGEVLGMGQNGVGNGEEPGLGSEGWLHMGGFLPCDASHPSPARLPVKAGPWSFLPSPSVRPPAGIA